MATLHEAAAPARIRASGTLDVAGSRQLKEAVARAAAEGSATIVLDLAAVTEIDAVCLGAILAADAGCSAAGRSLEVVLPAGRAGDALRLLGGAGRLRFRPAAGQLGARSRAFAS